MQPRRLYLKNGADPKQAIETLHECVTAANNLRGGVGGALSYISGRRDVYLDWVEHTEMQLSNFTDDTDVLAMLQTAAYWEIRQLGDGSPRPIPLIDSQIDRQARNLGDLRDDLARRYDRALSAPGHIAIVDTNVLLHYLPPDNINWNELLRQEEVRLVIPLRVIEELDEKKYTASDKLRSRARELLPKLYGFVGRGGAPKPLRDDTTIEVFIQPGPRERPSDADTEILETAHELRGLSGQAVTIVSGDTGMRLRAETEGIATAAMPDAYRG